VLVLVDVDVDGFGRVQLRSGPFEGPATVKPSALPEDAYSPARLIWTALSFSPDMLKPDYEYPSHEFGYFRVVVFIFATCPG